MNTRLSIAFVYVIFLVGGIGHNISWLMPLMKMLTPFVLLIIGMFVLFSSGSLKSANFIRWFTIAYIFTLVLEIIGVKTGIIFGEYDYGDTLGLSFMGVPLIIGFNWVMSILGCVNVSKRITGNIYILALISGLIAVAFDILLEPAAVKLGYWSWTSGSIPLQNYVAWFVITAIVAFSFLRFKVNAYSKLFVHYLIAESVFFILVRFS